jgi:hypothetical protein
MRVSDGHFPLTAKGLSNAVLMQMVRQSKRSWWIALYRDGRQLAEYETLVSCALTPLGLGRTSRWETIPKDGMMSVRLLCPNGQIGELWGGPHQFFQLKCAVWSLGRTKSAVHAHLVGVVDISDGGCQCWVWEPHHGYMRGFRDNVYSMAYEHIGALNMELQGLQL